MIIVTEHHLDLDAALYRMRLAEQIEGTAEEPILDDEGVPVTDEEGNIKFKTVTFPVLGPEVEVVWSADDERWFDPKNKKKRRADADVAAEQRRIMKDIFKPPSSNVPDGMPETRTMPGSGDEL